MSYHPQKDSIPTADVYTGFYIYASCGSWHFILPSMSFPISPSSPLQQAVKEGYLVKQGGRFKTWRRRFFRLGDPGGDEPAVLTYHVQPKKACGRRKLCIMCIIAWCLILVPSFSDPQALSSSIKCWLSNLKHRFATPLTNGWRSVYALTLLAEWNEALMPLVLLGVAGSITASHLPFPGRVAD